MDKRKITIIVSVVVGLVVIFFISKWIINRQTTKREQARIEQKRKETQEEIRLAALQLHQVCRYADSVGVDTTRFAAVKGAGKAGIEAKLANLLMEIRYGKKPSRLTYSGLPETVDSAWSTKTSGLKKGPEFLPAIVSTVAPFGPYNQLVGHYNRLRKAKKHSPAVTDSLRLIRQTLNFYRYINRFDPEQFVLVNIPAGELNVFDRSGKRLLPMQVITGKPDKRTPCMTTYIKDIVAYPYWNVPKNIALEEMLPRMQRNLAFIYNQNLQILDEKNKEVNPEEIDWASLSETNFPYRVRQASGCENSLGLIKFDLENPLAIYLHDTNSRDLFALTTDRWRSHGCVRVQKPIELANLVLGKLTFDDTFMSQCLADQKPKTLAIPKPFPVFIAYNIADVDAAGKLRFYKDVYGLDK
jgi:hypothetical protein